MKRWLQIDQALMLEDTIIRFRETVWDNRRRRKDQKGRRWGAREILGQILDRDGDRIQVKVISSRVLEDVSGYGWVRAASAGETLQFSVETILAYGWPERLAWSDEEARAAVVKSMRAREVTDINLAWAFRARCG